MAGKDNAIGLVARYDGRSGRLQLAPVAAGEQRAKSLELGLIKGNDPALSLGVPSQTGVGKIALTDTNGGAATGHLADVTQSRQAP